MLLALGVCLNVAPAVAGPATAPGSSPPGGPGDPGVSSASDFGLSFSGDIVFSPVFTSPVQKLFSAPTDFPDVGTTGQLPGDLWTADTQLLGALIPAAAEDPQIAPMASELATLAAPIHREPPYSSATRRGKPTYYCLTQAQLNEQQYRYWSFTALTEPQAMGTTPFVVGSLTDQQAANDPADTNDEWCGANLPKSSPVEPFTMNIWGPVAVLSLGLFAFWAARGFRSP